MKQLLTQALKTGDITVISNVTSVTAVGTKVARVEEIAGHEQESPSAVHVDFKVKQPSHLPAVLEDTESLGLILQLEDAVELGLLLVAMGMEHKSPDEIEKLTARLSNLIDVFEPA
ncbi:hypothetical protein [Synechococcus sp. PCC 7335]|uniref:hypothetical protein n=1 Tax=Synechococcus sp. (strain ATCC 29403 / PCC 7335) TaxID=91464 RepID=UPI001D0D28B0|nr:hypothetical protein [Synechococcus sp. PCC 7335]